MTWVYDDKKGNRGGHDDKEGTILQAGGVTMIKKARERVTNNERLLCAQETMRNLLPAF